MLNMKKIIIFLITFYLGSSWNLYNLYSMEKDYTAKITKISEEEISFLSSLDKLEKNIKHIKKNEFEIENYLDRLEKIRTITRNIISQKYKEPKINKIIKELVLLNRFLSLDDNSVLKNTNELYKTVKSINILFKEFILTREISDDKEFRETVAPILAKLSRIIRNSNFIYYKKNSQDLIISIPSKLKKLKVNGLLQDLLIESGRFELEDYITELKYLITTKPFKNKQKSLSWEKETINFSNKIFLYMREYTKVNTQTITTVPKEELERQISLSRESIIYIYEATIKPILKEIRSNKEHRKYSIDAKGLLEELDKLLESIKFQQKVFISMIFKDLCNRSWVEETLADLIKDSNKLADLLNITSKDIWREYINPKLLTAVFDNMREKNEKKAIRQLQDLMEIFEFRI